LKSYSLNQHVFRLAAGLVLLSTLAILLSVWSSTTEHAKRELAESLGPFKEYKKNAEPMLNVMKMHRVALDNLDRNKIPADAEHREIKPSKK